MKALPTRIDRYPAKMVSRLAATLLSRYAIGAEELLDPFCGSGAILHAAQGLGIRVTGMDVNPYAILLSDVKLSGFSATGAMDVWRSVVGAARLVPRRFPVKWDSKGYWFTPKVLDKYEALREVLVSENVVSSPEGKAILLAFALSVRLCSRADQRSPKPFISKRAILQKRGRHIDPFTEIEILLQTLSSVYGSPRHGCARTIRVDMASGIYPHDLVGKFSHVVTSPPYINAQDYFRNFKLELYFLEGILDFRADDIKPRFIGTERGVSRTLLFGEAAQLREQLVPELRNLGAKVPVLAKVVHRYLLDMETSFHVIAQCLEPNGTLVIVCGDNLVAGIRIKTFDVLNNILESLGFLRFDSFSDTIQCRSLAPMRLGHKGLIKEEVVSAFRKCD